MAIDMTGGLGSVVTGLVCQVQSLAMPKGRSGIDVDKAVRYLLDNAEAGSVHKCARYVRLAMMEGGGLKLKQWPEPAKEYGPTLKHCGFLALPLSICTPAKGDVCVFQPCKGTSTAGHIQMYTGEEWCSDFIQDGFWPSSYYEKGKASYAFYRP
jgi:hypothetical protein